MVDQSLIKTGFDCEFLMGGDYLCRIFSAAYSSGKFLNKQALENPIVKAILSEYNISIQSYDIAIKGTVAEHTFTVIEGINNSKSEQLHGFLKGNGWLSNNSLKQDFDPMNKKLKTFLDEKYDGWQEEIINLLQNALRLTILHIGAPYKCLIFNDNRPVDKIILDTIDVLSKEQINPFLLFLQEKKWLDAAGLLSVDFDTVQDEMNQWLEQHLPDYKKKIMAILKTPPDLKIHIPIRIEGEHTYANGETKFIGEELNEIIIFIAIDMTADSLKLGNPVVHEHSVSVLNEWGNRVEIENLGNGLAGFISQVIPKQFDMSFVPSAQIQRIEYKKLQGNAMFAPAYGVYCNMRLDLRALTNKFSIEEESRPENVTGEKIELSEAGFPEVKDKEGNIIPPEQLIYSSENPQVNNNSILTHSIGNISLKRIDIDEEGNLFAEYHNGHKPSPEDIVELAKRNPPRGDTSRALNFLRPERDFAIGLAKPVLRRFQQSQWNAFYVPFEGNLSDLIIFPGSNHIGIGCRPVYNGNQQVGVYKDLDLRWHDGSIKCTAKLEYTIDYWPDADVFCRIKFSPSINDYKLRINADIEKLNVDTGIMGDILATIIGGLTLGPLGLVGGPIALEVAEYVIAKEKQKENTAAITEQAAKLFETIPVIIQLFQSQGTDIAYNMATGPTQLYEKVSINSEGMILSGQGGAGSVNYPLPLKLTGRIREKGTWELKNLVYTNDSGASVEIRYITAHFRIQQKSLRKVTLTPAAIYEKSGRIHSIKFNSGVDLQVSEVIQCIKKGIVYIPRVHIRKSQSGREYLRTKRDITKSNNLGELPKFKPADLLR
ncbi:MAG: DUF3892 domain-containing protein [Candidatus Aureabacteria bacterium]|nr:DUF3892 domain-containing protein [Candidatus Auribacterota bacterium]MCK5160287.1 DUF3892 domain-containing protein [Candidatus Auribacterota bacterium]